MALRSGYKGFKKLLGLKTIRPGTLAVDDAALANTFFPRSEQAVLGAKNIIPFPYVDQNKTTDSGVTYTVNSDGTVELNATQTTGTPEMQLTPYITDNRYEGMILSDGGNATPNYYMRIREALSDGSFVREYAVSDNKLVIPHMESGHKYYVGIRVSNTGVAIDNVKFYPMISFDGGTFVSPVLTNKELMNKKFDKLSGVLSSLDDLDNILEPGLYSITTAPTNSPESQGYCTLLVQANGEGDLRQIIFKGASAGVIYIRSRGGYPTQWYSWYKFQGTQVV